MMCPQCKIVEMQMLRTTPSDEVIFKCKRCSQEVIKTIKELEEEYEEKHNESNIPPIDEQ